jgi:early secretory antigenic target protein ESAT-6
MTEIHVSFEALESGAAGIRANYAKLTATLEELENALKPMLATWNGAAQEAYLTCKQQWDEASLALSQVLSNIGQAVGQANENYQTAEGAALRNWS